MGFDDIKPWIDGFFDNSGLSATHFKRGKYIYKIERIEVSQ